MSTPNPPIPRPWTTRIRDIVKNIGLYRPRTPHSRLFDEIAPGALRPDNPNTVVVIVVGMDCAGKKTLLHNFLAQSPDGSDISTHTPFVGFDMAILSYGNVRFHAFDTACCRPKSFFEMERKQYQIADAVIQMIDLADRERWVESKEELAHGALHEGWGARKGTPMLVMCNGTDKEGVKDASQDEVAKLFRLDGELEERHPWVCTTECHELLRGGSRRMLRVGED